MNKAFEKILERLDEMIHPKQLYFCKYARGGCKHLDNNNKYCTECVVENAIEIVQEVAEEYKGGWIPCNERLPEEYGDYLVWWTDITRRQYYEIAEYEPNNGWIGEIPQAVEGIYSVIAWQPLPEPFKECD